MANSSKVVLSVSSQVAHGSVGNRAMSFALERLGFTVIAVPTVLLPYHPGHAPGTRIVPPDNEFEALLRDAIQDERGTEIAGIVSGYFASAAQAHAVARVVAGIKAARPDVPYLCDPVIGDAGHIYVGEALATVIRDTLVPLADAATPNAFECVWLAGQQNTSNPDFAGLARGLLPPVMLITSVPALMRGQIGTLLVTPADTLLFEHPQIATPVKGTGDLLAALVLARRLQGHEWPKAVELGLASVFEVVAGTAKAGGGELMLAELQISLIQPRAQINVRRAIADRPRSRCE